MKVAGIALLVIAGAVAFGSFGAYPSLQSSSRARSPNQRANSSVAHRPSYDWGRVTRSEAVTGDEQNGSSSDANMRRKIDRLAKGREYLKKTGDYTAKIQKQEVVHNELLDEQTIVIKCRNSPFSVYLYWETGDPGREVIYVEGKNNGRMIAHDGGWKARIPALRLNIDSSLAMRDARYPVTDAGLLGLIDIMQGVHQDDLLKANVERCELDENQECQGRPCECFTTVYRSKAESPVYRKSVTFIDREWSVPLMSRHFEWPREDCKLVGDELDEATLIESYMFTEINFRAGLSDHDFDHRNKEYNFH